MNSHDGVVKVLARYKLNTAIPFIARFRMLRSKRRTFVRILKRENPGLFIPGFVVRTRDIFRRMNSDLSLVSSARLAYGFCALALCVVAVSATVAVNYLVLPDGGIFSSAQPGGFLAMADGDLRIFNENQSPVKAESGAAIRSGDRIETGAAAFLLIQIKGEQVGVMPDTIVTARFNDGNVTMDMTRGEVVSKVVKLAPDENYELLTPNAIVRVRGTSFDVRYAEGRTTVSVNEGKVRVIHRQNGESIDVDAGNVAEVVEHITVKPLEAGLQSMFDDYSGLMKSEDRVRLSPEEVGRIRAAAEKISGASRDTPEIKDPVAAGSGNMTLDQIFEKYGRVEEVTLYNGKTYNGATISRGESIRFDTPDGVKVLATKDVRSIKIIR
jgi:hypothetical protein